MIEAVTFLCRALMVVGVGLVLAGLSLLFWP